MTARRLSPFTATSLLLWGALLVWAVYFLFVYVTTALACERGFADVRVGRVGLIPVLAGVAWVVSAAATGALVRVARRRHGAATSPARRFVGWVALLLGLLALVALAWTALPTLLLDTGCA